MRFRKWERGEEFPGIETIDEIRRLYRITGNFFVVSPEEQMQLAKESIEAAERKIIESKERMDSLNPVRFVVDGKKLFISAKEGHSWLSAEITFNQKADVGWIAVSKEPIEIPESADSFHIRHTELNDRNKRITMTRKIQLY